MGILRSSPKLAKPCLPHATGGYADNRDQRLTCHLEGHEIAVLIHTSSDATPVEAQQVWTLRWWIDTPTEIPPRADPPAELTDAQWAWIAPLLPLSAGRRGRPFRDDRREVVPGLVELEVAVPLLSPAVR
jgi:hypothetical protein